MSLKVQSVLFSVRLAWSLVRGSTIESSVLIPVKFSPFHMLLQGAILCQAFPSRKSPDSPDIFLFIKLFLLVL